MLTEMGRVISGSASKDCDALRVVREELRLDVAVDEESAAQLVHQPEPGARERHVELDLEGRRGEHDAADPRRVVVHPGRDQHGADALRDDGDVLLAATPCAAPMCSTKVCTSRTEVPRLGL